MTGVQAMLFGALFTAVSTPLVLMALGVLPAKVARGVPLWVVQAAALCFAAVSVATLTIGFAGWRRTRRRLARLAEHAGEPWHADHDWDPDRVWDDNPRQLARHLAIAAFMVVFLAPFHWWAFLSDRGPLMVQVLVGFFDAIMLIGVGYVAYRALQLLKFGRSYVRFGTFPMGLGETARLTFGMRTDLRSFDRLQLRLRFVEEVFETRGTGDNRARTVVPYELWRDERELDASELRLGSEVSVEFELPAGLADGGPTPLTSLSDRPPRYWELQVTVAALGVDYAARFPLPVYRSADAPPAPTADRSGAGERHCAAGSGSRRR